MIYTAIDTFYLTDEELTNSPSRKDGIDEATETILRIYGCDLIQGSGILLRLIKLSALGHLVPHSVCKPFTPQAIMATGQVLFHRFFCKKSLARFNVKRVAASCVWLASKLEESPRRARHILNVFHRMDCRRENLPIEHLDAFSKNRESPTKGDGFRLPCSHKFISNYLTTLEAPGELRQEAWNLANDSLRTTLCVRFKSAVVACGVVYAAARRFKVPLPENPPWWKPFDADKSGIDEVCRVLAHLYSLPKAQYIPVCKDGGLFTTTSKSWDSPAQPVAKESTLIVPPINDGSNTIMEPVAAVNSDLGSSKDVPVRAALGQSRKSEDDLQGMTISGEVREESVSRSKSEHRTDNSGERMRNRERERDKEKERLKVRDRERGRDSDRERDQDDTERDRGKVKDRGHRSKDSGYGEKSKHHFHSSRDGDYYSSRDKDRERGGMHHSYS